MPTTRNSFLKENGASLTRDISDGTELSVLAAKEGLTELAKSGLISSNDFLAFAANLQTKPKQTSNTGISAIRGQRQRYGSTRRAIRESVREQLQHADSTWFLTSSFAVMGKKLSDEERANRQARLLLQRYGILAKEWYRREKSFLPWYQLFQALRRMEWQGDIRRGYFVAGLSGVQFALPEAVEMLEQLPNKTNVKNQTPVLLSTIDPALPFGRGFDWALQNKHGNKISVTRGLANHIVFLNHEPIWYSENYATRLHRIASIPESSLDDCVTIFKTFLQLPPDLRPHKKVQIELINDKPAATCKMAETFLKNGFEKEGEKIGTLAEQGLNYC